MLRPLLTCLSCTLLFVAAVHSAPSTTQSSDLNAAAYTAPPLPATNPIHWQPPTTEPTITDPLGSTDFDSRSAALLNQAGTQIDPPDPTFPNIGVVVTSVTPKSTAEKLGIHPGDFLTQLGNQNLQYRWQFFDYRDDSHDQPLTILSSDGKSRTVTIHSGTGLIGVQLATRWDAESAWLRSRDRQRRFDRLMRIAALAHGSDPPLAWSALAKLQAEGCDGATGGYVPPTIACLLCYEDLRFDDAITFGRIAMQHMPSDEKLLFAERVYKSALAIGRIDVAAQTLHEQKRLPYADDKLKMINRSIQRMDTFTDDIHPNPLAEIDRFPLEDFSTKLIGAEDRKGKRDSDWTAAAKKLSKNGTFQFSAPDASYQLLEFGPPGADVDATLEFSFTPEPSTQMFYSRTFNFRTGSRQSARHIPLAIKAYIDDENTVSIVRYSGDHDYDLSFPAPPDGHWRARMLVLGQRCEFILNGRRIYYGPVEMPESKRQLGLMIQVVGVNATIHHLTWRILSKPQ